MNIEIKDLDELIGTNKIKISGYEIDLNDMPLSSFLEVNAMIQNTENVGEERILEKVIYPIIKKTYFDVSLDELKEKFTYRQIIVLWQEIIKTLYPLSTENESEDAKGTQTCEVKKK